MPSTNSIKRSTKLRNQMTQCQGCLRPKAEITLKRCTKCLAGMYCSEKCQREHWKYHKERCRITEAQKVRCEKSATMARMNMELFKWTAKHRPTLAKTVVDALDLYNRHDAHENELLMVFLSYQPQAPTVETRFRVISVGQGTYEALLKLSPNPLFQELTKQRALLEKEYAERDRADLGCAFCLLTAMGPETIHRAVPVSFTKGGLVAARDEEWISNLVDNTDNGTLL
ncbi:hypothetical protein M422DRAFT_776487 [Sphaerobolus stellatus SS14]|nr:hypothetical protein M422DRAFT_776487 [Sphaerobolus stellatus SS14]